MRTLRLGPLWIAVGWLLVAGLVVVSLVRVPDDARGLGHQDKVAHVVAYLLVMAWFVQVWSTGKAVLAHGCFLILLGIALEIAQGATGHRSADALDAAANAAGVVLGMLVARTRAAGLLARLEARLIPPG